MRWTIFLTRRTRKLNNSLGKKLLNAPYLVWSAIFIVVPLAVVAYYAFTDANGNFTLQNIVELGTYKDTFLLSIVFSFIATVVCLLLAYPFAYFMSQMKASSQRMMMLLIMLPMWMNLLIRTYSWITILDNKGIINSLLGMFGIGPIKMLGTPFAVILGMIYNYLPYMILPIYNIMVKIEGPLIEAADDLGANAWNKLRRVILPMSLPGVVSGIIMVFVPSISTFYISQKLGEGKYMMIGNAIERQFMESANYNLGASLSLVLMILILICTAIMNRFSDSEGGEIVV